VLADIQLADGSSGIDAVNDILKTVAVPVIFITAYPERLLSGERAEPVFLVSKPFHHNSLKAIISQALFFEVKAASRVPA
jgi:CheY-like chemotaxis protein